MYLLLAHYTVCEVVLEGHIRDSGVFLGYGIVWMQFLAEMDRNEIQRETNNAASMASCEDDLWILNEWLIEYKPLPFPEPD